MKWNMNKETKKLVQFFFVKFSIICPSSINRFMNAVNINHFCRLRKCKVDAKICVIYASSLQRFS